MKPLNVFIFPTDDRSGQAALIYHYAKLGHHVYLPKYGTLGLNWPCIATWPALLTKSTEYSSKRNIEIHGFHRDSDFFGEDHFLNVEGYGDLYDDNITCTLVDLEKDEYPHFDLFHTLRGAEYNLFHYQEICRKFLPNAKWISSTFNNWKIAPAGLKPVNAAKFIPANYAGAHTDVNNVNIMCNDFEFRLLGLKDYDNINKARFGYASFNHNFHIRQPSEFELFTRMNSLLKSIGGREIPNYGGNVRAQGSDIRYALESGITGKYDTLSPRRAMSLMGNLRASILFKQTDWGGGVFYHSMNSCTPIITTNKYVRDSNSSNYLIDGFNSIHINSPEQAANAIIIMESDLAFSDRLIKGMRTVKADIFDNTYWNRWENFVERSVSVE